MKTSSAPRPILSPAKLESLERLARSTTNVPGCAAECGVYQGGSLRVIAQILYNKAVYGFDTFAGLPTVFWTTNDWHTAGQFDCPLGVANLNVIDLANVHLMPGLFPDTATVLERRRFCFVHVDFDFYLSTLAAIEFFVPRMSPGGVLVFDDYRWPDCPGVERAIRESGLIVEETVPYQAVMLFDEPRLI